MKECTDCKKIKPYAEFHKEKKAKDGYRNQCKDCTRKRKARTTTLHKRSVSLFCPISPFNAIFLIY